MPHKKKRSRYKVLTPSLRYLRDPVVVLVLAISFVLSVVLLHIIGKLARWFYK